MKMTKARKKYTCDNCQGAISKGEKYAKKSKRIGSTKPDTIEARSMDNGDRYPVIVSHCFSYAVQICEACV